MTVADETSPSFSDFVIVEANVVTRDGAAREPTEEEVVLVSSKMIDHHLRCLFAILHRLVEVAPPLPLIVLMGGVHIRQTDPDEIRSSANSETHVAIFNQPTAAIS